MNIIRQKTFPAFRLESIESSTKDTKETELRKRVKGKISKLLKEANV